MPAEPNLIKFAQRVSEDIPEEHTVSIERMEEQTSITECIDTVSIDESGLNFHPTKDQLLNIPFGLDEPVFDLNNSSPNIANGSYPSLSDTYDMAINFFGRFKHKIIQPTMLNN